MRARPEVLAVAAVLLLLPVTGRAQKPARPAAKPKPAPLATGRGDVLPLAATERTLPNGLRVIVVPTGFPHLVSLQIPVQTGSRNEVEPGKSGFAHFFEHMMFRGTKTTTPDQYSATLTRAGARSNAYTTDDYTNYHTTFAKEDLDTVLRLEADRFQNLSYAEEGFKTESRAVLGEYNKNSADPVRKLLEVQRDHAYSTHTYKHTTMGFLRDIEDMPNQFAYSKVFFDRWYRPEYTTVIVAGDVTAAEVMPLVEKYWGTWKKGTFKAAIPQEGPPRGPVYAHVPWTQPALPWVTVGFRGPRFSVTEKDWAALDTLLDLTFGDTSDAYHQLVEQEQKVDQMFVYNPQGADPAMATVFARVKDGRDAVYVRDVLLAAAAGARFSPVSAQRLADARDNARYGLVRSLDTTEAVGSLLARFVRFERSFDTLNRLFRVVDTLTPDDLQRAAQTYLTDERLAVTTLAKDPLPEGIAKAPSVADLTTRLAAAPETRVKVLRATPSLPRIDVKLLFRVGSAQDPPGKEGLATLTGAMIAEAGSAAMGIDEIKKALFPMAGSFEVQVDKEMTTFTGIVHKDNARGFLDVVLPQLLTPGFRTTDFERLKAAQLNALRDDLRSANDEELGKERLQGRIFTGTAYAHPALGTEAGIAALTLEDVQDFAKRAYVQGALTVGLAGDVPKDVERRILKAVGALPRADAPRPVVVKGRRPEGREVEIVQKDARATAISFGLPIAVTRSHPDFAALSVARAWLGEHRATMSHLYDRIREKRGMNYGDYAYIEAFPRGMYQFFPDPNLARQAQIFEVWIRPVAPENAVMALRIALHELDGLLARGLSAEDFESARTYLMKSVYLLTANQDQQIGYALDSEWYGIPDYATSMREKLGKLTVDDVNQAVRKHLSTKDLSIVMIAKDAEGLKQALVSDAPSTITYDAPKPPEILEEDKVIGAEKLGIREVVITPAAEVFAK